jgi:hypothetical protein
MPRLLIYWTTAVSTTCPTFPNLPVFWSQGTVLATVLLSTSTARGGASQLFLYALPVV